MSSIYVYGATMVLSLGIAFYQWNKPPSTISGEEVVVLYGEEHAIELLTWDSEKDSVEISRKKDDRGEYLWATYTDKKKEKDQTTSFKVGKDGEKLFDNFSPMIAIRQLENVAQEKMEEIGLNEPKTTITLTRKGEKSTFSVGSEAYGTKDVYIQHTKNNNIFLLDDAKIRALKFGRTRLPDQRLWELKSENITKLTLSVSFERESKSFVIEHKNWQDRQKATWIRQDQPDADNKQLTNWITKFLRTKSKSYASGIDEKTLTLAFSMKLEAENTPSDEVFIYHDAEKKNWYAKSGHSRGLVTLIKQVISGLHSDMPSLFATEALPEESDPAK